MKTSTKIKNTRSEKEYRTLVASLKKEECQICHKAVWYTMTFQKEKELAIKFLKDKNL